MAIRVIHTKVEEFMNTMVAYSSVKNAVGRLARSKKTGVQRAGLGVYVST